MDRAAGRECGIDHVSHEQVHHAPMLPRGSEQVLGSGDGTGVIVHEHPQAGHLRQ
jgi:hypothetical protein